MLLEPPKYNDIVLANDFTVCNLCASNKAHDERIMTSKAARMLQGSFVGKYCLKIGEVYICEDCLSHVIADIALKKKSIEEYKQFMGDDIIESLDAEEPAEETATKKTRGRKKVEA